MSNSSEFREGDRVRITVEDVVVTNVYQTGRKSFDGPYEDTGAVMVFRHLDEDVENGPHSVNLGAKGVTVEHAAPAEWPPQPGDLWRDCDGDVWLVCMVGDGEVFGLTMICAAGAADRSPEQLAERFGPLTLVHREDEQDGGRS